MSEQDGGDTTHQEVDVIGTHSTGEYENEPCPDCGVVQQMEVFVTEFETPRGNVQESHHTDRECPVCGNHIEVPW